MLSLSLRPRPLPGAAPARAPDPRPDEFRWNGARAYFVVGDRPGAEQPRAALASRLARALRARRALPLMPEARAETPDLQAEQAAASAPDLIIAVGGDGTANAAAVAAMALDLPLLIVPAGTMNLVARDLGFPARPSAPGAPLSALVERRVDVGTVNGRCFLHSSLLGFIPALARRRDRIRHDPNPRTRLVEACRLALDAVSGARVRLWMDADGTEYEGTTMSVVVSCNPLTIRSLGPFRRPSLEGGRLAVYLSAHRGRLAPIRLLASHLAGRIARDRAFRPVITRALSMRFRTNSVSAANDGELVRLSGPLQYSVLPRALRVLVPAPSESK